MSYLKFILHSLIFCSLLLGKSWSQEINACDIEAAHPSDPNHLGDGKLSNNVDTFAAIAACRKAVDDHPKTARFHYQLGRSLTYQGEFEEGQAHVTQAADMGYMQAQFVLGLLIKGKEESICKAESLTRAAAEQGLKSARITYVNDTLARMYAKCEVTATQQEMTEYLASAKEQMSGYYEKLLLSALSRELSSRQD